MRKLLLSFIAVMFFAVYVGHASAQEQPEEVCGQQMNIIYALMAGVSKGYHFMFEAHSADATDEQIINLRKKMMEALESFGMELEEKVGDLSELSGDQLNELAETTTALSLKLNAIMWKIMEETLPSEAVEKIEVRTFQQAGGIFGGALAVENLTVLRLDAQQKEKAVKIGEKVNREFFRLIYFQQIVVNRSGESDIAAFAATLKENVEKFVSLARDGQKEIELLLTDEQKKQAEELMADVPEEIRFLSDYLKEHPEPKIERKDAPLVEIAVITDTDLAGVSIKVKELLLREGIESVIEDSEPHFVSVAEDKAEKAVDLIQNDEFLRGKQIRIMWDYLEKRLVNIGFVLGPDLIGVATKLYEFMFREGIDLIIEGSVVYGVEVDKDHADRAIELIQNDEYWGNSKEIGINANYIKTDSGEK